jgi:hypothetical protein
MIYPIAYDVGAAPEWDDKLAVVDMWSRASALRGGLKGCGSRQKGTDDALSEVLTVRFEKLPEPYDVGSCSLQEEDLHGLGGGNSFAVPQLFTHSSIAARGIASPVC